MRYSIVGLIIILLISSCHNKIEQKGEIVATVHGRNLYKTDLQSIVYEGISYNDSVIRAKSFIDKWIRNQLLLHQAKNNLDAQQLDFSKRLEEYHNSLVINKYETELIRQNLDTEVTSSQIEEYYNSHTNEFILNRNIVRIASVSISKKNEKKRLFTKLLQDQDTLLIDSISSMAEKYSESYNLNTAEWHNFEKIIKLYSLDVNDQKKFLERNNFLTINEADNVTLLRFCEYRTIGEVSPCELESEKIKFVILSLRKKELINELYNDLYTKAIQENTFEIF